MEYNLSIVVVTHNSETYVSNFLNELKKILNVQIIIVDSFSTDKTCEIIAKQFPEFKLYLSRDSRPSCARQLGLNLCEGKYVWFVDPDDIVFSEKINEILPLLDKEYDLIQFSADVVDKQKFESLKCKHFNKQLLTENIFSYFLKMDIYDKPYLWFRFYNHSFLLSNKIKFLPNHLIGEDLYFNFRCFNHANSLLIDDTVIYQYNFCGYDSITYKYHVRPLDKAIELSNVLLDIIKTIGLPKSKKDIKLIYDFTWGHCVRRLVKYFYKRRSSLMIREIIRTFKNSGYKNIRFNLIFKKMLLWPFDKCRILIKNHIK